MISVIRDKIITYLNSLNIIQINNISIISKLNEFFQISGTNNYVVIRYNNSTNQHDSKNLNKYAKLMFFRNEFDIYYVMRTKLKDVESEASLFLEEFILSFPNINQDNQNLFFQVDGFSLENIETTDHFALKINLAVFFQKQFK